MDTYVFAGGGSGGHLFPAIAVARELRTRRPDARIVFIGGRRPLEGTILSRESFERRQLVAASSPELIRHPLRFVWRNWQARRIATNWLRELRPQVVIGCGGYVSVPVALAAHRAGTPVVLLEQNVVPGRATSWLSRRARVVCTSFEETREQLPRGTRSIVTGNPVRPEISALALQPQDRSSKRATLLVLGGSQGAASINAMLMRFAEHHAASLADWRIIHQTGANDEPAVRVRYEILSLSAQVSPFLVDMAAAYAAADVAVSRAGATTLAELACAGVPAVLIPYPGAVRNHQQRNAAAFVQAGAAVEVTDGSTDALTAALLPLLSDPERAERMSQQMRARALPTATQRVADEVLQVEQRPGRPERAGR